MGRKVKQAPIEQFVCDSSFVLFRHFKVDFHLQSYIRLLAEKVFDRLAIALRNENCWDVYTLPCPIVDLSLHQFFCRVFQITHRFIFDYNRGLGAHVLDVS